MRTVWLITFGFLLLSVHAAVATLVPQHTFAPNLMLPIVMCLGASSDVYIVRGAFVSFVFGYMLDAFCGNPMGLHTFVLVAAFMLARLSAFRLFPRGSVFTALLTFGMAVVTGLAVLALRAVFEQKGDMLTHGTGSTLRVVVQSALVTAVLAPPIFAIVRRIDGGLVQKPEERANLA
jgi:rod shape-determining protein MreD